MSKVIIDNFIVDDDWALVTAADTDPGRSLSSAKKIIVPLKIWQAKSIPLNGKTVGVSLDSADDPGALESRGSADYQQYGYRGRCALGFDRAR